MSRQDDDAPRFMNHQVFVQVWCEVDPTLNLRVDRQTGAPIADHSDQLMRVGPLGRFGLTTALQIPGAEVVAFCLGEGHEAALRHALAAGASRAVQLKLPSVAAPMSERTADPLACARGYEIVVGPLADWLRDRKPDLVIADRIAGRIAARLGWAHLAGLDQLRIENGQLRAIRQLGRGDCESVMAKLPAVVRLQTEAPRLRYIARAKIMQASHQEIERVGLTPSSAAGNEAEVGPLQLARPRTKLGATPAAAPASGLDRLSALMGIGSGGPTAAAKAAEPTQKAPQQMAEEFVRYLAHHNLLNDP